MSLKPDAVEIPDELTITLRKPVEFAGVSHTVLRLKEPKVRQFKALQGMGPAEAAIHLVFLVAAIPVGAIEQIGSRDLIAANKYLQSCCAKQRRVAEPEETRNIDLRAAITHDDGTVFGLALREPTSGEMKICDPLVGIDETVKYLSLITGEPVAVIEQLGMRDFRAAEAYLEGFL